ncbi:PTS sugar transporter subunit IIB [Borrelia miyamotoi]|uniref:PTS sugar transporter subunit IIB n=1 Tax=Borrelia miyamotoi TaxID=47466 RepID=A0AAQ2WXM0_9SPIR|nr:PTS sugar transporter subunit IIB [Borrelia miyamotoi]AOW96346.1 PTS sugar transporter subunit IIB [Borrelia miyamotoi]QTL84064.1 PTS sugar transporter subunit IIB [Borrelia miyamotoi]WAZ85774.1 PTS sugar transporter subunit IIB [Borrelia miyamotoi]WAZ91556.1 PTS sugar transporter subunit IIB [Borrelia miyamotoi]WAZ92844.1 PTS sugar transporter subunit IIB [Borrelia miyamotoi]
MRILLICSSGMSTSILLREMEKCAKSNNLDVKIEAASEAIFSKLIDDCDIVLLAPQIRFNKAKLELIAKAKGVPIELINTIDYGTMNGDRVLKLAFDVVSKHKSKEEYV